ncbi:hypothetical protein [Methanobrevibacter sp.]|uniref:hypothetical protein n=1 Tax=Methanobrevibacter sp. TaxID=66852 RepID=UPI00388E3392
MAESYYGHRARLYYLDLYSQPEKIAEVILAAYDDGVRAINLVNDENLLKGFDLACDNGCEMKVIATIGKSDVDYLAPNYEVACEVDWEDDIELFSSYDTPVMMVDEFITDAYKWNLTSKILTRINDSNSLSGIVTAFPYRTTDLLKDNMDLDLFDFYMLPLNSFAYMMDTPSFLKAQRKEFRQKILDLNKKIMACRVLSVGIQTPEEGFTFLNSLDFVDLMTFGAASVEEIKKDMEVLKGI